VGYVIDCRWLSAGGPRTRALQTHKASCVDPQNSLHPHFPHQDNNRLNASASGVGTWQNSGSGCTACSFAVAAERLNHTQGWNCPVLRTTWVLHRAQAGNSQLAGTLEVAPLPANMPVDPNSEAPILRRRAAGLKWAYKINIHPGPGLDQPHVRSVPWSL
jgi:hypothetical protein